MVGEFGELCTMCEAIILCEQSAETPMHESIPKQGEFTLFYIQTRTFWSQMGTIWEWFIANFDTETLAQGHSRPVWVYTVTQGSWQGPELKEAHMALEPPYITIGDELIMRSNRRLMHKDQVETVGYCQRLPLWNSIEAINENAPGTPGAADS